MCLQQESPQRAMGRLIAWLGRALSLLALVACFVFFVAPASSAAPQRAGDAGVTERFLGETSATSLGADLGPVVKSLKEGKSQRALTQLQRIKDSSARNKRLDRILFLEALAHLQAGSPDEAQRAVEQSLALRGSNSDALVLHAELLSSPERQLDALTQAVWFDRFIMVSPTTALRQKAAILIKMGEPKRAERAIATAIARSPDCVECRLLGAELSLAAGNKTEAVSALRQSLAASPDDTRIKAALARTLLSGAQRSADGPLIAEAKQLASDVYRVQTKDDSEAAALYGRALLESGDLQAASKVVALALAKNSNDPILSKLEQQIRLEKGAGAPLQ